MRAIGAWRTPAVRVAASVAAVAAGALGCGATTHGAQAPPCGSGRYGLDACKETADGYLVPKWYYGMLQIQENTAGVPKVAGKLPPNPSDRRPATRAPAGFKAAPDGTPTRSP